MNKKIIFSLLFLTIQSSVIYTQPAMGVEITFPLSALLYLLPAGQLSAVQNKISSAGGWGHSPYWSYQTKNFTSLDIPLPYRWTVGCPQVDGYFATTDSFDIVLQPGVNQQHGFRANNGSYASPIIYFSDMMRVQRNWRKKQIINATSYSIYWSFLTQNNPCGKGVPCPQGPNNAITRGQPNNAFGITTDEAFACTLFWADGLEGAQLMKYFGFVNAKGMTLQPSSFKAIPGETVQFYFAQTGVGIYLPLHMVSPGSNLLAADPNYVNFGPAPGNPAYNQPIPGNILPWTHGYIPKNIPATLWNKPQTEQINF